MNSEPLPHAPKYLALPARPVQWLPPEVLGVKSQPAESRKWWGRTMQLGIPLMVGAMCLSIGMLLSPGSSGFGLAIPFLAGAFTMAFSLPVYVAADVMRRAWGLPPWGTLTVAAMTDLALGFLHSFGAPDRAQHTVGNALEFAVGIFFLPSLGFGLAYVQVLYVRRRNKT